MTQNYYDVLGVSKDATKEQISKAYKKLAGKWHPDKNQNNKEEAEKKFTEISKAYNVLNNEEKRNMYDQFGDKFEEGMVEVRVLILKTYFLVLEEFQVFLVLVVYLVSLVSQDFLEWEIKNKMWFKRFRFH